MTEPILDPTLAFAMKVYNEVTYLIAESLAHRDDNHPHTVLQAETSMAVTRAALFDWSEQVHPSLYRSLKETLIEVPDGVPEDW